MPAGRLVLEAPAKINLGLKVLGRRPDGYHDLATLFQPLELADVVELELPEGPGISLAVRGADLPAGPENLAFRAAQAFFEAAGALPRLAIRLTKVIPVAAGLGGGSSDAAAVLKGANRLFGAPFSPAELERLALGLGADVPFFIQARPAWGYGKGEILDPAPLPAWDYVLINPGFPVSTRAVFGALRKPLTPPGAVATIRSQQRASLADVGHLVNDLEEVVAREWPIVSRLREKLLAAGARLARMSGSGPTVFGLFADHRAAAGAAASLQAEAEGSGWRVILTRGRA